MIASLQAEASIFKQSLVMLANLLSIYPVMRASPVDPSLHNKLLPLVSIRKPEDVKQFAIGSDSDIGGHSQAFLDTYPEGSPDAGKGRFHGSLSSKLAPNMKMAGAKVDRSGYAGMRTKVSRCDGDTMLVNHY